MKQATQSRLTRCNATATRIGRTCSSDTHICSHSQSTTTSPGVATRATLFRISRCTSRSTLQPIRKTQRVIVSDVCTTGSSFRHATTNGIAATTRRRAATSLTFPTLRVGALQTVFLHVTVVAEAKLHRHWHSGDWAQRTRCVVNEASQPHDLEHALLSTTRAHTHRTASLRGQSWRHGALPAFAQRSPVATESVKLHLHVAF